MSTRVLDIPCFELYQLMVDKIFGNGVIAIKADKDNNVFGTLKYVDESLVSTKNHKSSLKILRVR